MMERSLGKYIFWVNSWIILLLAFCSSSPKTLKIVYSFEGSTKTHLSFPHKR